MQGWFDDYVHKNEQVKSVSDARRDSKYAFNAAAKGTGSASSESAHEAGALS